MFVVSFSGCPSVCHWHRLFVLSFLRRTWKNLKKTYFTFYRNDNHMSPIVKLNRATFHTGEPIEWVLLGEVHWRGGPLKGRRVLLDMGLTENPRKNTGSCILRYLSVAYRSILSVDVSTECPSTSRLILDQLIDQVSVDMSNEIGCLLTDT